MKTSREGGRLLGRQILLSLLERARGIRNCQTPKDLADLGRRYLNDLPN